MKNQATFFTEQTYWWLHPPPVRFRLLLKDPLPSPEQTYFLNALIIKFNFSKCYSLLYLPNFYSIPRCTTNLYIIYKRLFTEFWSSLQYRLYGVSKRRFILLSHFVEFELIWIRSHVLSATLMLEYLRIFFPIFFALKEQKKVK